MTFLYNDVMDQGDGTRARGGGRSLTLRSVNMGGGDGRGGEGRSVQRVARAPVTLVPSGGYRKTTNGSGD